jgi:hypothetical protein
MRPTLRTREVIEWVLLMALCLWAVMLVIGL